MEPIRDSLPTPRASREAGAKVRIIRPAPGGFSWDGGRSSSTPLELNLEDVQRIAERLLRDARERVARLEEQARSLEAGIAAQRAEWEREESRRRQEAEESAARELEARRAEAESLRRDAGERGLAEGREEGLRAGRDEGYRKGFEEGYREGREGGFGEAREAERKRLREELDPLAAVLEAMVREIGARRAALLRAAREELLPLALEIAKKVIRREVRECPETVLGNVRKAIDLSFRRTSLTVQVHPEDLPLLERRCREILQAFSGLQDVALVPAEDLARGGCRVVSGAGRVDLSIESQLELIERALFQRIGEGDPEEEISGDAAVCAEGKPLVKKREEKEKAGEAAG